MNGVWVASLLLVLLIGAALAVVLRKAVSARQLDSFSPEWLSRFSMAKYRPMERLLNDDDYVFLSSQPGYDPRISRKLRSERRRIFRQYLSCLRKDFNRLESALRLYMVYASEDSPGLWKALLHQRVVFAWAVIFVEFRLLLHWLGVGSVDIRGVLGPLDAMRSMLCQIALARQAAVA